MGVHCKLKLDSVKAPKLIDINYYAYVKLPLEITNLSGIT